MTINNNMFSCLLVLLVSSYEDEKYLLPVLILRAWLSCCMKTAILPQAVPLAFKSGMTCKVNCRVVLQYYQLGPNFITKIVQEN
jgi:hypothetical protein